MLLRPIPTTVSSPIPAFPPPQSVQRWLPLLTVALLGACLVGCGHGTQPLPKLEPTRMSAQLQPVGQLLAESRRAERFGNDDEALALALQALRQIHRSEANGDLLTAGSHRRATLHAKAALIRIGQRQDWNWLDPVGREIELADGSNLVVVHDLSEGDRATLNPREWSRIEPAAQVVARELPLRTTAQGVGVPLVFSRDVNRSATPVSLLVPLERNGEVVPATLLARFDDSDPDQPRMHLRWQATLETVQWAVNNAAAPVPVAADFSAPLEVFGAAGGFRAPALLGVLRPDRFPDAIELFRMTPKDPQRVPVVLVHGLASQPRMWRGVVNELLRDPEIRERCEFYYFAYPTSQPLPYVASQLRLALSELQHLGLADDGEVLLVGHSLGGLVSKMQVTDPGSRLWDLYFTSQPEQIERLGPVSQRLSEWLFYESVPVVGRVVFIATPHGGSEIADSWIGDIGRRLARVPRHAITLAGSLVMLEVGVLTDTGRRVANRFPTVVEGLSPESRFLATLRSLPVADGIGTHTIYGNRNAGNPDRPCTDGVVRCDSARLPGMDSELMVVSGHNAHENPQAIAELRRIIRLHLQTLGRE